MWELVSFAKGRTRRLCLDSLVSGPTMPSAIAISSGEHLPHVSRALRELVEKGLVECLTPNIPKNRIYAITPKGKEVLEKLNKIDN
jgi:DNA-binding PadR family transcriptional regulator